MDPDPGEWLVIFRKGRGYKLYNQGSRRRSFGLNDFRGLKCARLRTGAFEAVFTLNNVPLAQDLYLTTTIALTLKIDPESSPDDLLRALTDDAEEFTRDTINRVRVRLSNYVTSYLSGADERAMYRFGLQQALFPDADGRNLGTDFLRVTTANVVDTQWPDSLKVAAAADDSAHALADRMRLQNDALSLETAARRVYAAEERDEVNLAAADERTRRVLSAEVDRNLAQLAAADERRARLLSAETDRSIMSLSAETDRQIRLDEVRLEADIEMQKFKNASALAADLGCSIRSLPGPWSEMNDRTVELLTGALQSPHMSRRPEVLEAIMALASGNEVPDRRLRRQAEQTLDSAFPGSARDESFRRVMTEEETSAVLKRATFTRHPEIAEMWHEQFPSSRPIAASHCVLDDWASIIVVDPVRRDVPESLRAELVRRLDLHEHARVSIHVTDATDVESALRDLFHQATGGAVKVSFTAAIGADNVAQVFVRLDGPADTCASKHALLTDSYNPWLLAVESIFSNGKIRIEI